MSNTIPSETMLKRLPVLFFSFFISREADESLGNICFLSDSPKFSTESHFPPQRAKHLLHLDAITENENEKDQPPKHSPTQTPTREREYQLLHFLLYSFSHYLSAVFPSIPLHLRIFPSSSSLHPQATEKLSSAVRSRGFCMMSLCSTRMDTRYFCFPSAGW